MVIQDKDFYIQIIGNKYIICIGGKRGVFTSLLDAKGFIDSVEDKK